MSLQQIKQKIKTSESTVKITKVMQMVSTAKLQKIKPVVENSALYKKYVLGTFIKILTQSTAKSIFRKSDTEYPKAMIITVSSDKGLCGNLNTGLCKDVIHHIEALQKKGFSISLKHIGNKANSTFAYKITDSKITQDYLTDFYIHGKVSEKPVRELSEKLINEFKKGEFTHLFIAFNHFKNIVSSKVEFIDIQHYLSHTEHIKNEPEIDCNIEQIFNHAESQAVFAMLMFVINNNIACEHSFRMRAMDSATRNTQEIIKELTKFFNKTRQAYITKSLIDVVSGAESIKQ